MDSPTQNIQKHGIEYATRKTEINAVLTCVAHIHAEAVKLDDFLQLDEPVDIYNDTPCAERYDVVTVKICSDGRRITPSCIPTRAGQSIVHYVISVAPAPDDMGKVLELLATEFPNNTGFGVVTTLDRRTQMIVGSGAVRDILDSIARELELSAGKIIYITQYAVTGRAAVAERGRAALVTCPPGQTRLFRFGRWQCAAQNPIRVCTGATIWDAEAGQCVMDYGRKPLCAPNQTAVFTDDHWECMNPVMQIECPAGQTAHLDYMRMEWICISNPAEARQLRKCERHLVRPVSGQRLFGTSRCTECEESKVDPETCAITCVPAADRIRSQACYRGNYQDCSGPAHAFYFKFRGQEGLIEAARYMPALAGLDSSMNPIEGTEGRFNCLYCPNGLIDMEKSAPPFIAVCK